ncbi:hypothetical protein IAS59_000718 [Cryptococcus gattii]
MVPKIISTSSMNTKHTKRASCRARSNISLTPTSLPSPPLPPNIRLSPNCLSCYAPSYSRWPRDNASLVNGQ